MVRYRKTTEAKYFKKMRVMAKLDSYIEQASEEYKEYKKTKNTTLLAEAGEKLWGAVNHLIELKEGKSLKKTKEVKDAVYNSQDTNLIGLYKDAFALHLFFYGYTDRIEDIEDLFTSVETGLAFYKNKVK